MSKAKQIGTTGESAVKTAFLAAGFLDCRRVVLAGALDEGDLFVTAPSGTVLCVEVKAGKAAETASQAQISDWIGETERERKNSGADVGVLVRKRAGYGASRAAQWWVEIDVHPRMDGLLKVGYADDSFPIRLTLEDLFTMMRGRFL